MPKATIEFNLPEEQEEYDTCIYARDYCRALEDILELFRKATKYELYIEIIPKIGGKMVDEKDMELLNNLYDGIIEIIACYPHIER